MKLVRSAPECSTFDYDLEMVFGISCGSPALLCTCLYLNKGGKNNL